MLGTFHAWKNEINQWPGGKRQAIAARIAAMTQRCWYVAKGGTTAFIVPKDVGDADGLQGLIGAELRRNRWL